MATLTLTGLAGATPLALVTGEGGGEAQGEAEGEYYVDASGATDAATETHNDAQSQVNAEVKNVNEAYTEAQWDAYDTINDTESPQMEDDVVDPTLVNEVEKAGEVSAEHADQAEKAMDVESEYVDAGADVSFAAQAKAWMTDTFKGLTDVFKDTNEVANEDLGAEGEAKQALEGTLETENEIRNDVVSQAELDTQAPDVDPSVSGDATIEHATEVASSAAGQGEAGIP